MAGKEHEKLPLANVGRTMRQVLPPRAILSNDVKQCVQQSAYEFIRFMTGEAANICKEDKRKSMSGEDVIRAFNALGFYNYGETLQTLSQNMARDNHHPSSTSSTSSASSASPHHNAVSQFADEFEGGNEREEQNPSSLAEAAPFTAPAAAVVQYAVE